MPGPARPSLPPAARPTWTKQHGIGAHIAKKAARTGGKGRGQRRRRRRGRRRAGGPRRRGRRRRGWSGRRAGGEGGQGRDGRRSLRGHRGQGKMSGLTAWPRPHQPSGSSSTPGAHRCAEHLHAACDKVKVKARVECVAPIILVCEARAPAAAAPAAARLCRVASRGGGGGQERKPKIAAAVALPQRLLLVSKGCLGVRVAAEADAQD